MGKMNEDTFAALFEYGKRVYKGEVSLDEAAKAVNFQNPEVAVSSAKHYITWYSKMNTGEFLTWNTNSQLLLFYTKRIFEKEGVQACALAIKSAKQFAEHAARDNFGFRFI